MTDEVLPVETRKHGLQWVCMECHKPLGFEGVVVVYNANPELGEVGSYPVRASEDDPPWVDDPKHLVEQDRDVATVKEVATAQVRDALWAVNRPTNIGFGAFHDSCNPYADSSAYEIPGNVSATEWMAWVYHLHEKVWMGKWDLHRMLSFYWTHKGERIPAPR